MKVISSREDGEINVSEPKISKRADIPKARSQRAELIGYFCGKLFDLKGKEFSAGYIGMRLSHLTVEDLFYLKSVSEDIIRRQGLTAMQKHFFWCLKNK